MNKVENALKRTTDTKDLFIGRGVVTRTAEMFMKLFPQKTAVIVADVNTWEVAGKDVHASLNEAGVPQARPYVFEDEELYAEWKYVEKLQEYLASVDAVAIAVGSGVINDLTKYVSHVLGRRYMCVGTAASMDGYTAFGASITKEGNKQTFQCPAPYGFVMDSIIAAAAPKELAASGYADLIAKIPAGADWMLADLVGNDSIDEFSWELVQGGLRESLADPAAVHAGDIEKTEALSEGLLMSGFAMQAIQSSRPASGTEHQFSHCWDMENLCHEGKHVSHGFKVGIGTLASTAVVEFLLTKDLEALDVEKCVSEWKSWSEMEEEINNVFSGKPVLLSRGLNEARAKYVDKEGLRDQLGLIRDSWAEMKVKIKNQIIPFEEVRENLRLIGAPYEPEHIGVSRERMRTTFSYIPYMRSRFTALDVVYRCGMMDELLDKLFGKGGVWEIAQS